MDCFGFDVGLFFERVEEFCSVCSGGANSCVDFWREGCGCIDYGAKVFVLVCKVKVELWEGTLLKCWLVLRVDGGGCVVVVHYLSVEVSGEWSSEEG